MICASLAPLVLIWQIVPGKPLHVNSRSYSKVDRTLWHVVFLPVRSEWFREAEVES